MTFLSPSGLISDREEEIDQFPIRKRDFSILDGPDFQEKFLKFPKISGRWGWRPNIGRTIDLTVGTGGFFRPPFLTQILLLLGILHEILPLLGVFPLKIRKLTQILTLLVLSSSKRFFWGGKQTLPFFIPQRGSINLVDLDLEKFCKREYLLAKIGVDKAGNDGHLNLTILVASRD